MRILRLLRDTLYITFVAIVVVWTGIASCQVGGGLP